MPRAVLILSCYLFIVDRVMATSGRRWRTARTVFYLLCPICVKTVTAFIGGMGFQCVKTEADYPFHNDSIWDLCDFWSNVAVFSLVEARTREPRWVPPISVTRGHPWQPKTECVSLQLSSLRKNSRNRNAATRNGQGTFSALDVASFQLLSTGKKE